MILKEAYLRTKKYQYSFHGDFLWIDTDLGLKEAFMEKMSIIEIQVC